MEAADDRVRCTWSPDEAKGEDRHTSEFSARFLYNAAYATPRDFAGARTNAPDGFGLYSDLRGVSFPDGVTLWGCGMTDRFHTFECGGRGGGPSLTPDTRSPSPAATTVS